jgi:hypothetical protein
VAIPGGPGVGLFVSPPVLSVLYFTPPDEFRRKIPQLLSYPIYETIMYKTQTSNVVAGGNQSFKSNVIPLKCVPNRVYIYFGQNTSQETLGLTAPFPYGAPLSSCAFNDCTGVISAVNIQFGNKSGILSNADCHTLYQLSRKNGCTTSFTQWTGSAYSGAAPSVFNFTNLGIYERPGPGSVLCLSPAEDFGLSEEETSGCIESTQLIVQATVVNQSVSGVDNYNNNGRRQSENHSYILYIIIVNDGILSVNTTNYTWSKTIAPLSTQQSKEAPVSKSNRLYNFWTNLWGG